MEVERWQIEDYRVFETKRLFAILADQGLLLDEEAFVHAANECASPEELFEVLTDEENEKLYLPIFELWRRLVKDEQPLSIFCDELDYLFLLYDLEKLTEPEALFEKFEELENILDDSFDEGLDEEEIWDALKPYLAHDLEIFLFDYCLDLIDEGRHLDVSELVDGFHSYVHDKRRFDFLRLPLLFETDEAEAETMAERLIEELKEEPDVELLYELLRLTASATESDLFLEVFLLAKEQVIEEEDLRELTEIVCDYLNFNDYEKDEQTLRELLGDRPIRQDDLSYIEQIVANKFESV
ncbi:MAG: hypothetical protein SNF33_03285 [Candidatus Algichlamydia australiensis]|nr:hypothetical protein [Chlamydiales bacterium]